MLVEDSTGKVLLELPHDCRRRILRLQVDLQQQVLRAEEQPLRSPVPCQADPARPILKLGGQPSRQFVLREAREEGNVEGQGWLARF